MMPAVSNPRIFKPAIHICWVLGALSFAVFVSACSGQHEKTELDLISEGNVDLLMTVFGSKGISREAMQSFTTAVRSEFGTFHEAEEEKAISLYPLMAEYSIVVASMTSPTAIELGMARADPHNVNFLESDAGRFGMRVIHFCRDKPDQPCGLTILKNHHD